MGTALVVMIMSSRAASQARDGVAPGRRAARRHAVGLRGLGPDVRGRPRPGDPAARTAARARTGRGPGGRGRLRTSEPRRASSTSWTTSSAPARRSEPELARLPAQGADQHHPQLGARPSPGSPAAVSGRAFTIASVAPTIRVTIRFESTRRSSVDHRSGSVSRARSVASSRSTSSIWCRIASRTAGGPATRSRAMNAKCGVLGGGVLGEHPDRAVDDGPVRRVAASYVLEHLAQRHERLLDQGQPEVLDRVEVPVERGRHDADLLGHLAQGQGDQAAVLAEVERGVEDLPPRALLALTAGLAGRPATPETGSTGRLTDCTMPTRVMPGPCGWTFVHRGGPVDRGRRLTSAPSR